ncbi:MAG: 4Fe-4S binding protein [Candidatus Methanomethyliaceae archaeon]
MRSILSKPSEGASGLTGMWRIKRPIMDTDKCNMCMLCWLYCPEGTITKRAGGKPRIVYEYCKGCGICAEVCPSKAIIMLRREKGAVDR